MIKSKLKNKIYVIPTALTYLNMLFGLTGLLVSMRGDLESIKLGAMLVLLGAFSDKLDGYVARKTGTTSDFGRELDSLCDLVSFGLAPIIIGWNFGMASFGSGYIIASILFIGCGIFRLARYNVEDGGSYIIGLPITIAGGVLVFKYIIDVLYRLNNPNMFSENLVLINILSLLMILRFKIKKPNIWDEDLF